MSWERQGHLVIKKSIEVQLQWTNLVAAKKEPVFIPATAWSLLADYRFARGWGERTGSTGSILISPSIQLAPDPKEPDEVWEAEYPWKSDGVYGSPNGWRELDDPSFKTVYVRAGWLVRLPEEGAHQHVAATGVIELSVGE